MADDKPISLVNLGSLSKPANTLIKKVSAAIGGLFEPWQIERVAKAQAKADLISAQSQIQITDLHRRAMYRFVEEEAQRQHNMESITAKALPQLDARSDPDKMEDDWVTNFFDKSRIVSDEEMQGLWARVLSGEANSPGTYSKRTVNFLGDLDKVDAELFTNLCRFVWQIGDLVPLIFDTADDIYNKAGINFNTASHLESIGLVQFNSLAGFQRLRIPKVATVLYYGKPLQLEFEKEEDNRLELGKLLLTKTGQELAPICGSKPIPGFVDYVKEKWKKHLPNLSSENVDSQDGESAGASPPPVT